MTAQTIAIDGRTWRFAPDTAPQFANNAQALLLADALDEVTEAPPEVPVGVTPNTAASTALLGRAALGGRVGLVGRPLGVFAVNAIAGAQLGMTLTADGFLPLALAGPLGAQPNYPAAFTPADLGPVFLHRAPTSIRGRTVSHDRTVRPGTAVAINAIWTTQSQVLGPPSAANLIAIAPGLYADRPTAGSARQFNVAPVLAQAKRLIGPADAGATQLRVSDGIGLAPGGLLIIDWPDQGRAEIVAISALLDPGATADEPVTAALAHTLRRAHFDSAPLYPASAGAAGTANALARAGQVGDVTLFPSTMVGLDGTMTSVEISGGAAPPEYHWAQTYQIVSDGDGYFRMPTVHRVAQVQLHATNGAEPQPLDIAIALDWGRESLDLDLIFPP
jgi:hypothetical protein